MRRAVSKLLPGKTAKGLDSSLSVSIDHSSVEDFYILLDNPHKSWLPGEEISGQVILISKKNLGNIVITFSLLGYIKMNALPHSKLRPMKQVLFNHSIKIYGPDLDLPTPSSLVNGLYKGEHRFPFVVKLPTKRIFTSIDFGKGAIIYTLKTTLRSVNSEEAPLPGQSVPEPSIFRPRALSRLHNPSFTLEKHIKIVDPIDVAELPPPKPKRLIIKDPRRGKLRRTQSSTSTINTASTINSKNSDFDHSHATAHPSIGSASSSNNVVPMANSVNSPGVSLGSMVQAPSDRPGSILVTMELGQRGFLRGELIPVKLTISHLKQVQDSRGIIVTLVRVCRIDHGPESYFESFRKDLQQLVIPLFVDPVTFSLEINTSLRVPADAFPTITGCPMVSFQYFVEVMLNLSGKPFAMDGAGPVANLVAHDDNSPSLSPSGGTSYNFQVGQDRSDFINTDKFKRLKKFLQLTTEVIIGTHRLEKHNAIVSTPENVPIVQEQSMSLGSTPTSQIQQNYTRPQNHINSVPELAELTNYPIPPYLESPHEEGPSAPNYFSEMTAMPMPMPDLNHLSEKDRMRQHEAGLLPSEPIFDSEDEETISPLNHGILDEMTAGEALQSATDNHEPHDLNRNSHNLTPVGQGASHRLHNEEIDLYDAPAVQGANPDGFGEEAVKDFVPNYDAAANDRLVAVGGNEADLSTAGTRVGPATSIPGE